jgi:hypothetical protein
VEALVENPELLLMKQTDKLKTERMLELKRDGVEYDQRIAELEKVTYPKPLEEFVYATFNDFSARFPWAKLLGVRPKGIAREMVESLFSFNDMIREYDLSRSEGLLLRYLADVHRTLYALFPEHRVTPELEEIRTFLTAVIRQADSSLVAEWERMRRGDDAKPRAETALAPSLAPALSPKELFVLVRNHTFLLLRMLVARDFMAAAELSFDAESGAGYTRLGPREWETAWDLATAEVGPILTTQPARGRELFAFPAVENEPAGGVQVLLDGEDTRTFELQFHVDIEATQRLSRVVFASARLARTGEAQGSAGT